MMPTTPTRHIPFCIATSLLLTREELLDILTAELGAFDDRMADARKHLPEPQADLTLADLLGAVLDPFGRRVHLALVGGIGRAPGQGHDREECRSDPEPATFPRHDAPPSDRSQLLWPASTVPGMCRPTYRRIY